MQAGILVFFFFLQDDEEEEGAEDTEMASQDATPAHQDVPAGNLSQYFHESISFYSS